MDASRLAASVRARRMPPPPLDEREANVSERRSERSQALSRAIIRNGWSLPLPPFRGKHRRRDERARCGARRLICASTHSRRRARSACWSRTSARCAYALFLCRLTLAFDGRGPALAAEPAYIKALSKFQDEARSLPPPLPWQDPASKVLDLCAGAGGKTLALAASEQNKGPIMRATVMGQGSCGRFARLERAGSRNVSTALRRAGTAMCLPLLKGGCDLVFCRCSHVAALALAAQSDAEMADAAPAGWRSGLPSRPDRWEEPPLRKARGRIVTNMFSSARGKRRQGSLLSGTHGIIKAYPCGKWWNWRSCRA